MPGFAPTPTRWQERLLAELRRDKKKTALLGALLVVGVVVGVRAVVMVGGSEPVPAQAGAASGPPAMPGVSAAAPAPPFPAPVPLLPPAARGQDSFRLPDLKNLRPRQRLTEDIFAMKLEFFPQDRESNVALANAAPDVPVLDPNQVRAATVLAKAKSLILKSTVISQKPKAVINGQLMGAGDTIQGFEVVEVQARSCILVQDGVQVVLEMKDH